MRPRETPSTDSRNSIRRWCHSRMVPGISARDSEAAITTAASVGCREVAAAARERTRASARSPRPRRRRSAWVLAPDCSATAVRDPLVLTGKPWKNPAATFAAPIPIISPLPSTSCPVRAANDEAVEIVSVSATSDDPERPGEQQRKIRDGTGERSAGAAPSAGSPPATHHGRLRLNTDGRHDRDHHGDEHARDPRQPATEREDQGEADEPDRHGGADRLAGRHVHGRTRGTRRSARWRSTEKPNSFGNWPTRIVSARPFM